MLAGSSAANISHLRASVLRIHLRLEIKYAPIDFAVFLPRDEFVDFIDVWNSHAFIPLLTEEGVDTQSEAKAQTGWREARARQGEAPIEDRRKRFGRTDHPGAPRHPSSARSGITKINPVQLEVFKIGRASCRERV